MNVLVTGANGFLGYYLVQQLLEEQYTVIATGKGDCRLPFINHAAFIYESLDFTNPYEVHDIFEKYNPSIVIHGGAMTKPDECEQQQWQAHVVNVEGTLNMLANAEDIKSFFIYVSTDFVFDGGKGMYKEDDERDPVNFYGKTKRDAEDAVMEYQHDWTIVRTVLVYGKNNAGRDNLVTLVKKKLENGETYKVFDDQVRTPTYVEDLASGIVAIVMKKATGIYHLSGSDVKTPYQMAVATAAFLGYDASLIQRAVKGDFNEAAKRPSKTGFNIGKARKELDFSPVSFEEGLRKTLEIQNRSTF